MKTTTVFLGLILSSNAFATDLDNITTNVKAVCQSPSQQGKYWNVTTTGKAEANGLIRLASVGVNGEATFTKGEWDGVQQVLQSDQIKAHAFYYECVEKLTPLFLTNFAKATPEAKPAKEKNAVTNEIENSTIPAENDKNTQVIGTQNANKIVNINEMKDGVIDMGK